MKLIFFCISRSSFFILIKKSEVNVLNRSSNMNLSFTDCVYNLRYYFIDQCCFHQTNLIVSLSQLFGWTILGSTFTNEQSTLIMSGAVLLCNDDFKKYKYISKMNKKKTIFTKILLKKNCSQNMQHKSNWIVCVPIQSKQDWHDGFDWRAGQELDLY